VEEESSKKTIKDPVELKEEQESDSESESISNEVDSEAEAFSDVQEPEIPKKASTQATPDKSKHIVEKSPIVTKDPWDLNSEVTEPKNTVQPIKEKAPDMSNAWGMSSVKKEEAPKVIDRGGVKIMDAFDGNDDGNSFDDDNSWDC
jgi:hypothetical protein